MNDDEKQPQLESANNLESADRWQGLGRALDDYLSSRLHTDRDQVFTEYHVLEVTQWKGALEKETPRHIPDKWIKRALNAFTVYIEDSTNEHFDTANYLRLLILELFEIAHRKDRLVKGEFPLVPNIWVEKAISTFDVWLEYPRNERKQYADSLWMFIRSLQDVAERKARLEAGEFIGTPTLWVQEVVAACEAYLNQGTQKNNRRILNPIHMLHTLEEISKLKLSISERSFLTDISEKSRQQLLSAFDSHFYPDNPTLHDKIKDASGKLVEFLNAIKQRELVREGHYEDVPMELRQTFLRAFDAYIENLNEENLAKVVDTLIQIDSYSELAATKVAVETGQYEDVPVELRQTFLLAFENYVDKFTFTNFAISSKIRKLLLLASDLKGNSPRRLELIKKANYVITTGDLDTNPLKDREPVESFARTLLTLRTRKGVTQEELAARLEMSHSSIALWEAGRGLPQSREIVSRLADVLGSSQEETMQLFNDYIWDLEVEELNRQTQSSNLEDYIL